MWLNNEWANNEIKKEIKRYLETNENESTRTPGLQDTEKSVLREKFIEIQTYLKKKINKESQIKYLTLYLKAVDKKQDTKFKVSTKKETIKIRLEITEIVSKKKHNTMKSRAVSLRIETRSINLHPDSLRKKRGPK